MRMMDCKGELLKIFMRNKLINLCPEIKKKLRRLSSRRELFDITISNQKKFRRPVFFFFCFNCLLLNIAIDLHAIAEKSIFLSCCDSRDKALFYCSSNAQATKKKTIDENSWKLRKMHFYNIISWRLKSISSRSFFSPLL
jgi:hypothetical protein